VTWILLALLLALSGIASRLYFLINARIQDLRDDFDALSGDAGEFFRTQPKAEVEAEPAIRYFATATVILDSNESQCRPGDERDITVTVSGEHDAPTGEVHLYDNGTASRASRRLVNGVATFHVTFPLRSRHTFTARYSGDAVYESQPESNSLLLVVI
jgi:hypothetical protein